MQTVTPICPICGGAGKLRTISTPKDAPIASWHSPGTNTAFYTCSYCKFEGHRAVLYQDENRAKYDCKMMLDIIEEYQGKEAAEKHLLRIVGTMDDAIEKALEYFKTGRGCNRVQREP